MTKRTTYRTARGTKRYLVHAKDGRIKDNQSYRKAHGTDVKRRSKAEGVLMWAVYGLTGLPFWLYGTRAKARRSNIGYPVRRVRVTPV